MRLIGVDLAPGFNLRNSYRQVSPTAVLQPQPITHHPSPPTIHPSRIPFILSSSHPAMDTLIAKYYTPQDDFFDDENSSMRFQSTKPSLDLKFSLPPISQVHIYFSVRPEYC